jgi:hypothetical protein
LLRCTGSTDAGYSAGLLLASFTPCSFLPCRRCAAISLCHRKSAPVAGLQAAENRKLRRRTHRAFALKGRLHFALRFGMLVREMR